MRITFKAKLLAFAVSVVLIPTVGLVLFFFYSFNGLTNFSLSQNTVGLERSNKEFLSNFAGDKARLTSLQMKRAIESVTILGKAAQKILDHYPQLSSIKDVYQLPMFRDNLIEYNKALTNPEGDEVNVLIPPSLVGQARSRELLSVSSLLDLVIGPVFESNENNTFVYFVGDRQSPVTRAFPNINLAKYLGPAIDALFWRDFFQDNVKYWERYYEDPALREAVTKEAGTPVTFDPPYEDAAGQGKIITLFYPLWNRRENTFGGAVGADVSLAKIVENILAVHVAQTGYALLINGKGEIVATSEEAVKDLKVETVQIDRNGLTYYYRSLSSSKDEGIRGAYDRIMAESSDYLKLKMDDGENHVLVFDSLDPINDTQYNRDTWKILINVPEKEILRTLYETHSNITAKGNRTSLVSLLFVGGVMIVVVAAAFVISGAITRSIGQLSLAAQRISRKDYDISVNVRSKDEIGELGSAFMQMSREIKGYTEHLEDMVRERTEELEKALQKISVLNEKLTDENLRLSAELDIARRLQLMVLPGKEELSGIEDLDIACVMNPADEVGGDYYDCFRTNGSVKIGIGDVTGHGLSAGVIMLMAQTAIKTASLMGERDMRKSMALVNQVLYSNIGRITEDRSMTLSLLDYSNRTFTLTGQHESVIICRRNGCIEVKDTRDLGLFVGFEPDISAFIDEVRIELESGDALVLYTDGATDAVNGKGEEYGFARLCESVSRACGQPAAGMLERLVSELYSFIGGSKIHDDISLMVVKQR